MPINYPDGEANALRLIEYIVQQEGKTKESNLYRYAAQYLRLDEDQVSHCINELVRERYLAIAPALEGDRWLETINSSISHLGQGIKQQLAIWCLPRTGDQQEDGQTTPRGRGAPPGNMNALRHGRYSLRLTRPYGATITNANSLLREIELARSLIADLDDRDERPVELIFKGITLIAKLVIAQANLQEQLTPPNQLPPGDHQNGQQE